MVGDEQFRAWAEIDYSIQTGKIAFDRVFGKPIFDYLGENPDKARIFDGAMIGIHGRESNSIIEAYDFSGIGVLADIGGASFHPSRRFSTSSRVSPMPSTSICAKPRGEPTLAKWHRWLPPNASRQS